jgi:protein phosphatase
MPVTFSTATHIGLVRHGNEDAALAQPPVFAVADGMGGALAGEVASGMAVKALAGYASDPGEPAADLPALVSSINEEIFQQASSDAGRSGMGTTLTAAVVADAAVDLIHVGDSRAYRLRSDRLEQLTEDHSLVGEMVRRGELTEAEALVHPQRSIITRALGVEAAVEIDSYHVELEPGDLFLLCSDGLFSMVSNEDMAAIIAGSSDLGAMAASLVEAANAGGGADNVTVVLFSPGGSVPTGAAVVDDGVGGSTDVGVHKTGEPVSGEDAAAKPKSWWKTWKALAVAGVVAIALIAAGTWYMTQQIYYLGVDDGRVAIYQGVPVDLGPLSLSSLYRKSGVLLDDLAPYEQDRILREELTSLKTAEAVMENYSDDQLLEPEAEERGGNSSATTSTGTGS